MVYFFILLPNLCLWLNNQNYSILLLSFCVLIFLYAIKKSTKYSFILLPFLWLVPPYLYYIFLYQSPISEQILSIVLETNLNEAGNFLGASIYWYILTWILWCIGCVYLCIKHFTRPKIWKNSSRYLIIGILTLYFGMVYILQQQLSNSVNKNFVGSDNFLIKEKNALVQDLKQTYPLGILITSYDLWQEQKKIQHAYDQNKKFKFHARYVGTFPEQQKQVYILIIGETSRRDNWQLNGYQRATNPLLSQQKNLVNFSDFLAISTETRTAIPVMLTRKPAVQVYRFNFPEKSIISAFKEAGFKTYWLSTQQRFGEFDTTTSVYAKEADEVMFLNQANYQQSGALDSALVPVFAKVIKKNELKQFIVIHTLGSHYNYIHRYPTQFNVFKPSLNEVTGFSLQDSKYKTELLNSYDNSILFTDYVLNEFIKKIEQYKISAFMFYSSDHGEALFDEGCHQSGHGLSMKNNLEIASFAWYSDAYKNNYPEKALKLQQNQYRKINQTAIFPTLLDAAQITIQNDELNRSILKKFDNYPRIVLGGKNYDTTEKEGVCQEIP